MKKLTILFAIVSMIAAVGCENKVTYNITDEENKAMMTIEEAGGRAVTEVAEIVGFLQTPDYEGVFFNDAGLAGYKIKNSQIYFVKTIDDPNDVNRKKDVWTNIPINEIAVDKNLNKLQYRHPDNGLEIITFDGFGYYYYIDGGGLPKYYKKYDYVEDKYAGTWVGNSSGEKKLKEIEINEDSIRRIFTPDKNNSNGSYENSIKYASLKNNTLTFKGLDGHKIVFNSDQRTGIYYYSDGSSDTITKR